MKHIYRLFAFGALLYLALSCKPQDPAIPLPQLSFQEEFTSGYKEVSLTCTYRGNVTIGSLYIEFSENQEFNSSRNLLFKENGNNSYTVDIFNLSPSSTYYYRYIIANDIAGVTDGTIRQFKTQEYVGPEILSSDAHDIMAASASLLATIGYTRGETINETGFYLSKDKSGLANASPFTAHLHPDGRSFDIVANDLEYGTLYYYQAYSKSKYGTNRGEIKEFTTLKASPILTTNPADDIKPYTATIHGQINDKEVDPLTEFGFIYSRDEEADRWLMVFLTDVGQSGQISAKLNNLSANTVYYFKVFATNSTGTYYSDTDSFTTASIPIEIIELNYSSLTISVGASETLVAVISPADATDQAITWRSSDQSVASVDQNGIITAHSTGTAKITASADGETATCDVTVVLPITSISLNKVSLILEKGTSETLLATIYPEDATDKHISWETLDASVATVDQSGKVTAKKSGFTTITAKAGDQTASCTVTVIVSPTNISLSQTSITLDIGENATLIATLSPSEATARDITWHSADPSIASVSQNGQISALKKGNTTITASIGSISASCTVIVIKPIESISLNQTALTIEKGSSAQLSATVFPEDASDKTISWRSGDAEIAVVDQKGKITAMKGGSTIITATAGDKTASCTITVIVSPTSITLSNTSLSIGVGQSTSITASFAPADATIRNATWSSSDPTIATVSQNGLITPLKKGKTTVTASLGNLSASCEVTVYVPVSSISLNKNSLTLEKGNSTFLTATISPADANDTPITWSSSNESIIKVEQNGTITAIGGGNATVTANAGGKTASCTVTVNVSVSAITMDRNSATIAKGQTIKLSATIWPTDATNQAVTWKSQNSNVATVDNTGLVKGVKTGSTTIVASVGNISTSCSLTVLETIIEVNNIIIDQSNIVLVEGQTTTITASIQPENASDKTITWSSMDPSIASISKDGVITAHTAGRSALRAAAGNRFATCPVVVIKQPTNYLTFSTAGECILRIENNGGNRPIIYYSTDLNHWQLWDYSEISFSSNLYLGGDNPSGFSFSQNKNSRFRFTNSCYCYGSVMALLNMNSDLPEIPSDYCFYGLFHDSNWQDYLKKGPDLPATELTKGCYGYMFTNCHGLQSAPTLPAKVLKDECYRDMFCDCFSLQEAPGLPATIIAAGCYMYMFSNCTQLSSIPSKLPAQELEQSCYYGMFEGCTQLTTAPSLPATRLANYCYCKMFHNCTSLTSLPNTLPATILSDYCYSEMFYGCTEITTAPNLPARILTPYCYHAMFRECNKLNYVKCLAVDMTANSCTSIWLYNVSLNGTFIRSTGATDWETGPSGIPNNWWSTTE